MTAEGEKAMEQCISVKAYKGRIVLYVLLQFGRSGLLLLPPYCYLFFLNEVLAGGRIELMWAAAALYFLVYAAKALVSVLVKRSYNRIFPVMLMEARENVLRKYSRLDIEVLEESSAGELRERLHKDTENAVIYLENRLELGISTLSILVTTVILLYLDWILALVSFALLPFSFYITRAIKNRSNVQYERRRAVLGRYNDFMVQGMFSWKEVKSGCLEEQQQEEFEELWKELGDAFLKSHIFWFLNRTFLAFKDVFLTKMGLYLLGGFLVIKGLATVPALLAFMEYYADYVNQLLKVSDIVVKRGEQEASIKRITEVMGRPAVERPYKIQHFEMLAFRNVSFSYEKQEEFILRDFCMEIGRGETVAIVGESGCGKSTLIKMMAGLLEPQEGEISWNGMPMSQIDRQELYRRVGFLMQECRLFNLSIRENLLFGRRDAGEEEMRDACNRANVLDFIQGLPDGFDTIIGENGIRLSGGQKQRLFIARLLLSDPEMIVFDEATSALDYQNEREILDVLFQNAQEKTFIMVTHRKTSLEKCDRVISFCK